VILVGHVDTDGTCYKDAYSDPYGTWGNIVVLGSDRITLQDYAANLRVNTNVYLRSGVACELSATYCTDIEENTFSEAYTYQFLSIFRLLFIIYRIRRIFDNVNEQA